MKEWNGRSWVAPLGVVPSRPPRGQRKDSGKWLTDQLGVIRWVSKNPPPEPELGPPVDDLMAEDLEKTREVREVRKRIFGNGFTPET